MSNALISAQKAARIPTDPFVVFEATHIIDDANTQMIRNPGYEGMIIHLEKSGVEGTPIITTDLYLTVGNISMLLRSGLSEDVIVVYPGNTALSAYGDAGCSLVDARLPRDFFLAFTYTGTPATDYLDLKVTVQFI